MSAFKPRPVSVRRRPPGSAEPSSPPDRSLPRPRPPGGRLLRWAALLVACGSLGLGCHTPKRGPGQEGAAAVVITGQPPLAVAHAVSEIFQNAGYTVLPLRRNREMQLAFERPGGTWATVLYGDWSDNRVWYRVKVRITPLTNQDQLVTCDVFRVLDHGDAQFEVEHHFSPAKKRPYQDLLNDVQARLRPDAK